MDIGEQADSSAFFGDGESFVEAQVGVEKGPIPAKARKVLGIDENGNDSGTGGSGGKGKTGRANNKKGGGKGGNGGGDHLTPEQKKRLDMLKGLTD
ncbi:hypothetical protein cyc_07963 [Cyclospora cayetanensis]|uniref:Uncharacterized protein n=1 Tax=Cyclospora cayetanensis TaxID=88456 RepID=A0A1D3D2V0_9EIME|nr:hypothetical protein cyc_07963 [Cyclospora cayetanensis]